MRCICLQVCSHSTEEKCVCMRASHALIVCGWVGGYGEVIAGGGDQKTDGGGHVGMGRELSVRTAVRHLVHETPEACRNIFTEPRRGCRFRPC